MANLFSHLVCFNYSGVNKNFQHPSPMRAFGSLWGSRILVLNWTSSRKPQKKTPGEVSDIKTQRLACCISGMMGLPPHKSRFKGLKRKKPWNQVFAQICSVATLDFREGCLFFSLKGCFYSMNFKGSLASSGVLQDRTWARTFQEYTTNRYTNL